MHEFMKNNVSNGPKNTSVKPPMISRKEWMNMIWK